METAVKANSWKPTSPIMAAMANNAPLSPTSTSQKGMAIPRQVAQRSMMGQGNNTPYWSPSTHTATDTPVSDPMALNAQEFVPGGVGSGSTEFVPNQNQGQQQQQQQQQAMQNMQGQGQVDGRLYDQHLQEQGGATYSESPLVQPAPKKKTIGSFFMSDRLQERYQHLNECTLRELAPQDPKIKLIPTGYTSIYPLDAPGRDDSSTAGSFGYP